VQHLLDSLFVLTLTPRERALPATVRRVVTDSSEAQWQAALDRLAPHKVFALLAHQLGAFELLAHIPESARGRVLEFQAEVQKRNALLLLTAARLLRMASQRGQSVLLLKGVLFADSYYPDPSTRPMSDIDLVAVRGQDESLFALLAETGFRPSFHHVVQDHSVTFMNREGVFCDAHRTLPMFDSEPWHRLVREVELARVRGTRALALEPNAMVAHLAAHMHGHAREVGLVLLWVVDLAYVLRRSGHELDAARVRKLTGDDGAWALLLRLLRLLDSCDVEVPAPFLKAARALPPMTLAGVLRQRRITPWGLPAPLGWARLLAHRLRLHRSDRPEPSFPDLFLWPYDELTACVSPPIARVAAR
jgi:hypothetical protein